MAEKINIRHHCVDEAVAIMREVADWGEAHDFADMWSAEALTRERLLTAEAQPVHFCVGELDGQPVCGFILQDVDSVYWPDKKAGEAVYLHKYCVRRAYAHRGITKN